MNGKQMALAMLTMMGCGSVVIPVDGLPGGGDDVDGGATVLDGAVGFDAVTRDQNGGAGGATGGASSGGAPGTGNGGAPGGGGAPAGQTGSIALTLTADRGGGNDVVVSTGVPFARGVLKDPNAIVVKNASGGEVPRATTLLAKWPTDGSVRSVLVAFRASLASGATAAWTIEYGATSMLVPAAGLAPNPDGPIAATLPAEWYGKGGITAQPLLPVGANKRFASYDRTMADTLWSMDWSGYGVSCGGTNSTRTYYDAPHAIYQAFLRRGEARYFRRAREEAVLYRRQELNWFDGRNMAVQVCQGGSWTPSTPIQWLVLRRMLSQGMLDDYLVTGDPAAREAVVGLGEAYRRNLPALTAGGSPSIEATERNLGWPLMGLASYYAVDQRDEVRAGLTQLVDRTVAWQARGRSGAFEHDIVRPDPSECGNGPAGASPFMTSLIVDGLMDAHWLVDDARIAEVVRKVAVWYETQAVTSDGRAFRYLWGCRDNAYDSSDTTDLNVLIGHVFGAAYYLTKDTRWLTFGDRMADAGIGAMYTRRPKQWDQAGRSFGKYLGYRALGATP